MTGKRRRYSREFKLGAVRLSQTGRKGICEIERELGISRGCLSRWRQQVAREGEEAFLGRGPVHSEKVLLRELKRENEILRQERDIQEEAVAIFTQPKR